jgi:hypothetical protein
MAGAETTVKTAVLEGTIEVKSRIIATGVVPDPSLSRVDVGGIRVIGLVVKMTNLRSRRSCAWLSCARFSCARLSCAWLGWAWLGWAWGGANRRRPVRRWPGRNKTASFATTSALLREGQGTGQQTERCEKDGAFLHLKTSHSLDGRVPATVTAGHCRKLSADIH